MTSLWRKEEKQKPFHKEERTKRKVLMNGWAIIDKPSRTTWKWRTVLQSSEGSLSTAERLVNQYSFILSQDWTVDIY